VARVQGLKSRLHGVEVRCSRQVRWISWVSFLCERYPAKWIASD
jgi:hypothetical protein